MPSRFTVRLLAALALAVAIMATACNSDDASDDDPQVFPPNVPTAAPTEPAAAPTEPAAPTREPTASPTAPEAETLAAVLEAIRAEAGAPALAAAVFSSDGTIIDAAAVGVRRSGGSTPIAVDDRFQLGSETKAMTAALAGRLAEQGAPVSLDTPVAEAFPGLPSIDEGFAAVTLAHLLSHTAGIDDDFSDDTGGGEADDSELTFDALIALPVDEQRASLTQYVLELPPAIEPGTVSHYSNVGYVVAGSALEAATGTTWEELMRAELFEPLAMDSCGFGEPGADGSEAPWGHDATGTAIDPTLPTFDFGRLAIAGPAATVHCPMADWVKFLSELMRGLNGESDYLSQSTVERLFTPADAPYDGDHGAGYALGWIVYETPIGPLYAHDGSNGFWYASVGLSPGRGQGMVAVSNGAGPPSGPGMQAAQAAIGAMAQLYLPPFLEQAEAGVAEQ